MPERCDCCDLPLASCGKASERRESIEIAQLRTEAFKRRSVTAAKFPGRCPRCSERIDVGDPISQISGEWRGVLCCG